MDIKKIYDFLIAIDDSLPVKLSDRVDVSQFANKIVEKANVFVETENDKIIGLVAGYINDTKTKIAYISMVGVLDEYRGRGISRRLLKEFIDEAEKKEFSEIHLDVEKNNQVALRVYTQLGFTKIQTTNKIHMIYKIEA